MRAEGGIGTHLAVAMREHAEPDFARRRRVTGADANAIHSRFVRREPDVVRRAELDGSRNDLHGPRPEVFERVSQRAVLPGFSACHVRRHFDSLAHAAPARGRLGTDLEGVGRSIVARVPFLDLNVVQPDRAAWHDARDVVFPHVGQNDAADLTTRPVCRGGHVGTTFIAWGGLVAAFVSPLEESQRHGRVRFGGLEPRAERVTHAGADRKRSALQARRCRARPSRRGQRAVQRQRDAGQIHRAQPSTIPA